ncbi:hypothetical protein PSNTI_43480 [Stutzerimonas stutzeri]|nr:hypothetical protein PSNTI_43480 [Stutzerimonas stutzeri]
MCRAAGFYWGAVFRTFTRGTADGCLAVSALVRLLRTPCASYLANLIL